jgi:hypothetical protein
MSAASDSRLASAVGYAPWFLDVLDAEWAAERLPQEEFLAAAAAGGELPLVLDADGEEIFGGAGGSGGGGGGAGGGAAAADLQWSEPGTDLLELEEQQNDAFSLTTATADFARAAREAAAASAAAAAAVRDAAAAAAAPEDDVQDED